MHRIKEQSGCAPCVRAHRFVVKTTGIISFFLLAALYSWIQDDRISIGTQPGSISRQLLGHHGDAMQQNFLDSSDPPLQYNAADDSSKSAPYMQNHSSQCAGVSRQLPQLRCQMARVHCTEDSGRSIVNYLILHYCGMGAKSWVSVPVLVCVLILAFYILAETAENYFSPVVRRLVGILGMTPSMGGVTLLALGNGAPDIFASLAAIGGDNSRIGLGAILSAGTFVSAFVVGAVALAAAPFSVRPLPFVRDLLFYFLAVCALFMVYLKGEIVLWQAIGMMSFYALFVVVVIFSDQIKGFDAKLSESEGLMAMDIESPSRKVNLLESRKDIKKSPEEINQIPGTGEDLVTAGAILMDVSLPHLKEPSAQESERGCLKGYLCNCWAFVNSRGKELLAYSRVEEVMELLHMPTTVILKSTIPEIDPAKWSRSYGTANVVLCPLLILYMFTSLVSLNRHIVFLAPSLQVPIWGLVLLQGFFMGSAYYLAVKRPPESGQFLAVIVAFIMSVFWISFIAGELLGCLVTLGVILGVSPALLGLTVLAWGNSIGDLVADVAVARVGQPAMSVAGCFAGPMFNMLIGLGAALSLRTAKDYPVGYQLDQHPGILVAFGFLCISLLGTLLVVSMSRFQVTRFWGKCLISWYILFMVISVVVANMASRLRSG